MGRRNVGKSSLLNALARQQVAIVSELPGTTTDPVEKAMELFPLGPVMFIDTPGIDDQGKIGELRVRRALRVLEHTDMVIVVVEAGKWKKEEKELIHIIRDRNLPLIVAINKIDLLEPTDNQIEEMVNWLENKGIYYVRTSARSKEGIPSLYQLIVDNAPAGHFAHLNLVSDFVHPRDIILMVGPLDVEAPVGRLKLPQVQLIRNCLDKNACCLMVKESELRYILSCLRTYPKMVVCESHILKQVARVLPEEVLLTTFSVILARLKGDLRAFIKGAEEIGRLKVGDRVLIAEACTHPPIGEDIGTVILPSLLEKRVGGKVDFQMCSGKEFPYADLKRYRLIIHCGACMLNRTELISRIKAAEREGVAITNYGLAIAYFHNLLHRVIEVFQQQGIEGDLAIA